MKHNSSNRRSRGRGGNSNRRGGNNNRSQVFDSNGPDVRIRGTAHQICEKYVTLAKDARSSGDWVMAESYLQHAEHYQRMISTWDEQNKPKQVQKTKEEANGNADDLSLPNSILGDEVKSESSEGVQKKVLEEA